MYGENDYTCLETDPGVTDGLIYVLLVLKLMPIFYEKSLKYWKFEVASVVFFFFSY